MCISAYHFTTIYHCYYLALSFIFLHLLSTNHKCTQCCYFSLLYKYAAQKLKRIYGTLIWCFRLAITPDQLPVELCSLSVVMFLRVFNLVFCKDIIR
jgi:hypothetical protein